MNKNIISAKTAYQQAYLNNIKKDKIKEQLQWIMQGIKKAASQGKFDLVVDWKDEDFHTILIYEENIAFLENLGYIINTKVDGYDDNFYYIITWDENSNTKRVI